MYLYPNFGQIIVSHSPRMRYDMLNVPRIIHRIHISLLKFARSSPAETCSRFVFNLFTNQKTCTKRIAPMKKKEKPKSYAQTPNTVSLYSESSRNYYTEQYTMLDKSKTVISVVRIMRPYLIVHSVFDLL